MIIVARRGIFAIRPGRLVVRRGDAVIWLALGSNAQVFIPNRQLFPERILHVADMEEENNEDLILPEDALDSELQTLFQRVNGFVIPDSVPYGIYPYSIFCDTPNAFAEGGSDPELIVGY